MKAEKGSEIITTICEYENSVAMPDNERLTYLDTCGIARLKDGNGNVKAQSKHSKTYPVFRLRKIAPVSILTGFCNARSALDRYAGH